MLSVLRSLCLAAGYPEYELVPGGANLTVHSGNLGEWIDLVVDATLGSGVAAQLEACRQGFNEVRHSHQICVTAVAKSLLVRKQPDSALWQPEGVD
jgi:hypothetical protein